MWPHNHSSSVRIACYRNSVMYICLTFLELTNHAGIVLIIWFLIEYWMLHGNSKLIYKSLWNKLFCFPVIVAYVFCATRPPSKRVFNVICPFFASDNKESHHIFSTLHLNKQLLRMQLIWDDYGESKGTAISNIQLYTLLVADDILRLNRNKYRMSLMFKYVHARISINKIWLLSSQTFKKYLYHP